MESGKKRGNQNRDGGNAGKKQKGSNNSIPNRGRFKGVKKHAALFNTAKKLKGILLACEQNREDRSVTEMFELLNHFAAKFYPPTEEEIKINQEREQKKLEKKQLQAAKKAATNPDVNNNEQPKKEEQLQKEPEANQDVKAVKRFKVYSAGGKGHVFIEIEEHVPIPPVEFVTKILSDPSLHEFKKRCKNTHKLIPAEAVIKGDITDIMEAVHSVVLPHFPTKTIAEGESKPTFGIMYGSRNNTKVDRKTCIEEVAKLISADSYKVDLKNPQLAIIIEIFKSACIVSVVKNFVEFHKYNIQKVMEEQENALQSQDNKEQVTNKD